MDFIFNELSLSEPATNRHAGLSWMKSLLGVCKKGRELGMGRLAVREDFYSHSLLIDYKVMNWLNDTQVPFNQRTLLISILRYPYIEPGDEAIIDRFVSSDYSYGGSLVEGLAVAHLYNTISLSVPSSENWNLDQINLILTISGREDQIVSVRHASTDPHIDSHSDWIAEGLEIDLAESPLRPENKQINLRDDHGKDVLNAFSKRIRKSPYITKVINSLPFNPHDSNFIKKCSANGTIEIVLTRTDAGYGIVVQTTGRNLRETEKIAKLLDENFSQGY